MAKLRVLRGCLIGLGINLNRISIAKIVQKQKGSVITAIRKEILKARFLMLEETPIIREEFKLNKNMAERKCIDESIVADSGGRATCSKKFDSILARGCVCCPKTNLFNKPNVHDGRSEADKAADSAIIEIIADGVRDKARDTGSYWKI